METQAIINLLSPIKDNIAKTAKMSLYAVFKWFWIYLCSFLKIYHVLKLLCEVHWSIGLFFLLTASKRPYKISVPIILQHLLQAKQQRRYPLVVHESIRHLLDGKIREKTRLVVDQSVDEWSNRSKDLSVFESIHYRRHFLFLPMNKTEKFTCAVSTRTCITDLISIIM